MACDASVLGPIADLKKGLEGQPETSPQMVAPCGWVATGVPRVEGVTLNARGLFVEAKGPRNGSLTGFRLALPLGKNCDNIILRPDCDVLGKGSVGCGADVNIKIGQIQR